MQETGHIHFNRYQSINDLMAFGPLIIDRELSLEEFKKLCLQFPDLQMERENTGKITIMAPIKGGSGKRETRIQYFISDWCYKNNQGEVYSPSTGFILPDTAMKSPDCAWVSDENLAQLTADEEEDKYLMLIPDFVVEIRSKSDRLPDVKKKMQNTWMNNGVKLAWLIDPYEEKVHIYRKNKTTEIVEGFEENSLSGEDLMAGLVVPLLPFRLKNK